MQRLHRAICVAAAVMLAPGAANAAEDLAVKGTVWVGTLKRHAKPPGKPVDVSSTEVKLVVTRREGDEFEADLWAGGASGLHLKGKIVGKSSAKSVKLTVSKVLKGDWADDIVGRIKVVGSLKGEKLKLRYTIPAAYPRWGEIEAKFDPEAKPDERNV